MSERDPFSKRLFNLGIGAIYVILAFYVAIEPDVAIASLIVVLGVVLILSGIIRIFNAFYDKEIGGTHRVVRLLLGLAGLLIGIGVIVIPDLGLDVLVILLAVGLLLQGLTRVYDGVTRGGLPNWLQLLLAILGLITIGLAVFVFISIDLAKLTLVLYLAYGFLINGFGRLIMAITGYSTEKQK